MMILIAAALFCLLMMAQLARAQPLCAPLPDLLNGLRTKFGEQPMIRLISGDTVFLLTRSDTGGWSLIRVIDDMGCLIATGKKSEIDRGI
ncbi:MAG: hypothetical protein IT552_12375 [Sphingomonadaceae bacterium]|nr:hypothetical protein [Sphingomonadaceae bacterium]